MGLPEYLIAAPWWHWVFFVLIAALLAKWRPIKLIKRNEVHTHEHKHVHTTTEKSSD